MTVTKRWDTDLSNFLEWPRVCFVDEKVTVFFRDTIIYDGTINKSELQIILTTVSIHSLLIYSVSVKITLNWSCKVSSVQTKEKQAKTNWVYVGPRCSRRYFSLVNLDRFRILSLALVVSTLGTCGYRPVLNYVKLSKTTSTQYENTV